MRIKFRQEDSFLGYSEIFNIPLSLIEDANKQVKPIPLLPGCEVHIPGFKKSSYLVQNDESIEEIAKKLNCSLKALYIMNPQLTTNLCKGMTIYIPKRVTEMIIQDPNQYDYKKMMHDIEKLLAIYPFIKKGSIGETPLENTIPELLIGRGKKIIHINASFHANEWISTPVLLKFINEYLLSLTNGLTINDLKMDSYYENVTLSIVPMVNPDGVDLVLNGLPKKEPYKSKVLELNGNSDDFSNWKANINGVDLNNQFPTKWEIEQKRKPQKPAPRDFPGEYPLSETESLAMANLTKKRDFTRVIALHSQGKVIYWGYEGKEPKEAEDIVREFNLQSGYEPVNTIASYAGYKDWFIDKWNRSGFTVELGKGVNPLPIAQFDEIYSDCKGILLASIYM